MALNDSGLPSDGDEASTEGTSRPRLLATVWRALCNVWTDLRLVVREELEAAAGNSPAATRSTLPAPTLQLDVRGLMEGAHVEVYSDGQRLGTVVQRAYLDVNGQIIATRTAKHTGLLSWEEQLMDASGQAIGSIAWGSISPGPTGRTVPMDVYDAPGRRIGSVTVGPPESPTCRIFDGGGLELAAVMKKRHWVSAWYTLVRGERSVGVLERVGHLEWRISVCESEVLDGRLLVFLAASRAVAEVQQIRAARGG